MAMKKALSHILRDAAKETSEKARIEYLRKNCPPPMLELFRYTFDPRIEFLLPSGPTPYTKRNLFDQEERLYREVQMLICFCQLRNPNGEIIVGKPNLTKMKREQMFIQILESLHPDDATLLEAVKDKRLGPPGSITERQVRLAFPNLVWGDEQFFKAVEQTKKAKKEKKAVHNEEESPLMDLHNDNTQSE